MGISRYGSVFYDIIVITVSFQLLRYGNEEVSHHSGVHEEQTELQDYRYKDRTDWT